MNKRNNPYTLTEEQALQILNTPKRKRKAAVTDVEKAREILCKRRLCVD